MLRKFVQGTLAIAIPLAMLVALAAEASARGGKGGGPDPILGPQSCFWKTRNWHCRPL